MNFFKKWSLSTKLMVVNAGYILPCVVLAYFLAKDKHDQIEFNFKERLGVQVHRPLQSILTFAGHYKALIMAGPGRSKNFEESRSSLVTQIERDFASLDGVDENIINELKYTVAELANQKKDKFAPANIKAEWLNIVESPITDDRSKIEAQMDSFLNNLRGAIGFVGNASNLILDPDLDTYYLMDAVLIALPKLQSRVQETISFVLSIKDGEVLNEERRIRLSVLISLLKGDMSQVAESIQTALIEDKNFQGTYPALQRDMPLALRSFANVTEAFISSLSDFTKTAQAGASDVLALSRSAEKAMDANLAFWTAAADNLDALVAVRVESIKMARLMAILLAILAWLPIVVLAVVTVRRIGKSFSTYVAKLESEAKMANVSSNELAAASQTVSSGSTEQAAAIQETGASMSEMASMVSRSSTQAVSSQELARKVKGQTEEGCQVIERLVLSMESIQEANSQLQNISNIIADISDKTRIINDIVGKTQLLSFNASIEAARAGQHGRGFAVVAEEVGNLAQTSGNAAKEIRTLIEASRQQVEHILMSTMERVTDGKKVTEQAQDIFAKISKDISAISTQMENISEASREQQFGIEQIAKAMAQMDESTQMNNSAAFSAARLSDQLLSQSRKLTSIARTVSELVSGVRPQENRSNVEEVGDEASVDNESGGTRRVNKNSGAKVARTSSMPQDEASLDRIVSSIAGKERELDRSVAATPHGIDANDESFKKSA